MSIEDKMGTYVSYLRNVGYLPDKYVVHMVFPLAIKAYSDKNNIISVSEVQGENGGFLYSIPKKYGLDKLTTFIVDTINRSIEIMKKRDMFAAKVKELEHIFSIKSLDELQTLTFEFSSNNTSMMDIDNVDIADIDSDEEEEPNNDLKETHTKDSVSEIM